MSCTQQQQITHTRAREIPIMSTHTCTCTPPHMTNTYPKTTREIWTIGLRDMTVFSASLSINQITRDIYFLDTDVQTHRNATKGRICRKHCVTAGLMSTIMSTSRPVVLNPPQNKTCTHLKQCRKAFNQSKFLHRTEEWLRKGNDSDSCTTHE
jgi:hypothetical protein